MSPAESASKGANANNESDILIDSLEYTIGILKKELHQQPISNFEKHHADTYKVSPLKKESSNKPVLENNTDHIDLENEIVHELLCVEFEHL